MGNSACLFNTGTALRRVFITNIFESPTTAFAARPIRCFVPGLYNGSQSRTAAVYRKPVPGAQARGDRSVREKSNQSDGRLPRDHQIRFPLVMVRGEGNKLSEPTPPREILPTLDPKTHSLTVVALPDRNNERAPPYPICRIVDKKAELAKQLEVQKAQRKKAVQNKEIELNWAIAPHDLEHKLRQLKQFLEKGMRVQIMLLSKRKKRAASEEEAKETLAKVMETVGEVEGAKEFKAREGALLKTLKIFVDGPQ